MNDLSRMKLLINLAKVDGQVADKEKNHLINIGRAKLEHEYELFRDGLLLATASTTLACLDRNGRPRPLPAELGEYTST